MGHMGLLQPSTKRAALVTAGFRWFQMYIRITMQVDRSSLRLLFNQKRKSVDRGGILREAVGRRLRTEILQERAEDHTSQ